jgi:hypothetical protein
VSVVASERTSPEPNQSRRQRLIDLLLTGARRLVGP